MRLLPDLDLDLVVWQRMTGPDAPQEAACCQKVLALVRGLRLAVALIYTADAGQTTLVKDIYQLYVTLCVCVCVKYALT